MKPASLCPKFPSWKQKTDSIPKGKDRLRNRPPSFTSKNYSATWIGSKVGAAFRPGFHPKSMADFTHKIDFFSLLNSRKLPIIESTPARCRRERKEFIMMIWCSILFILGVLAFLDATFTFGEIFRKVNSVLFMLVSLGVLVRIRMKTKLKQTEKLLARVAQLESENKLYSEGKRPVAEPSTKLYE